MKKPRSLPFRIKLILLYCLTVVLVAGVITLTLTLTASRQVVEDKLAHLDLLAEQVLLNFTDGAAAASQQLLGFAGSKGLSSQMYAMRALREADPGYYQNVQSLLYAVNQMITTQTYHDALYVRLDSGVSCANATAPDGFVRDRFLFIPYLFLLST